MTAQLTSLVNFLQSKVDAIADEEARLWADFALANFAGAAGAFEKAAERGPVSYALDGRNFTFESKAEARKAMDAARAELDGYISGTGGTVLVDMGGRQW